MQPSDAGIEAILTAYARSLHLEADIPNHMARREKSPAWRASRDAAVAYEEATATERRSNAGPVEIANGDG